MEAEEHHLTPDRIAWLMDQVGMVESDRPNFVNEVEKLARNAVEPHANTIDVV